MKHRWVPSHTPLHETRRWRCKGCGLRRRRVCPSPASFAHFGFLRSFWMYQQTGSVIWTNQRGDCPRTRA